MSLSVRACPDGVVRTTQIAHKPVLRTLYRSITFLVRAQSFSLTRPARPLLSPTGAKCFAWALHVTGRGHLRGDALRRSVGRGHYTSLWRK